MSGFVSGEMNRWAAVSPRQSLVWIRTAGACVIHRKHRLRVQQRAHEAFDADGRAIWPDAETRAAGTRQGHSRQRTRTRLDGYTGRRQIELDP